jgi:hypothetical protein
MRWGDAILKRRTCQARPGGPSVSVARRARRGERARGAGAGQGSTGRAWRRCEAGRRRRVGRAGLCARGGRQCRPNQDDARPGGIARLAARTAADGGDPRCQPNQDEACGRAASQGWRRGQRWRWRSATSAESKRCLGHAILKRRTCLGAAMAASVGRGLAPGEVSQPRGRQARRRRDVAGADRGHPRCRPNQDEARPRDLEKGGHAWARLGGLGRRAASDRGHPRCRPNRDEARPRDLERADMWARPGGLGGRTGIGRGHPGARSEGLGDVGREGRGADHGDTRCVPNQDEAGDAS